MSYTLETRVICSECGRSINIQWWDSEDLDELEDYMNAEFSRRCPHCGQTDGARNRQLWEAQQELLGDAKEGR